MQADERKPASIPYFTHEGELARMERANHRLFIVIVVLMLALILSNAVWVLNLMEVTP